MMIIIFILIIAGAVWFGLSSYESGQKDLLKEMYNNKDIAEQTYNDYYKNL